MTFELPLAIEDEKEQLHCATCKHLIISEDGLTLQHLNIARYETTTIITISKDCKCGCMEARD